MRNKILSFIYISTICLFTLSLLSCTKNEEKTLTSIKDFDSGYLYERIVQVAKYASKGNKESIRKLFATAYSDTISDERLDVLCEMCSGKLLAASRLRQSQKGWTEGDEYEDTNIGSARLMFESGAYIVSARYNYRCSDSTKLGFTMMYITPCYCGAYYCENMYPEENNYGLSFPSDYGLDEMSHDIILKTSSDEEYTYVRNQGKTWYFPGYDN